jgi:hypothetical protein
MPTAFFARFRAYEPAQGRTMNSRSGEPIPCYGAPLPCYTYLPGGRAAVAATITTGGQWPGGEGVAPQGSVVLRNRESRPRHWDCCVK